MLLNASAAYGAFGLHGFRAAFTNEDGSPDTQAGSHPFAVTTAFEVNVETNEAGKPVEILPAGGQLRSLNIVMPPGFTGNPTAVPRCTTSEFLNVHENGFNDCSNSTVVGAINLVLQQPRDPTNPETLETRAAPIYNLPAPPGAVAEIGFLAFNIPVTVPLEVEPKAPYRVVADLHNISQAGRVYETKTELWGIPSAHVHDPFRGTCLRETTDASGNFVSHGNCETSVEPSPFITLPRACNGPLRAEYEATSWNSASAPDSNSFELPAMTGCEKLAFGPTADAKPTSSSSESPTGLEFRLDVNDPRLTEVTGLADSDIEKTVVTLPEGITTNPAVASGLAACTLAQFQSETLESVPGTGCPEASKVGSVEAETPLLSRGENPSEGLKVLNGSIYVAKQHDNPFDNLLTIYVVIKDPELGVLVSLAGKVEPDARTGQLTTSFADLPQVPISEFRFHFRTGERAPLITPPVCGRFVTRATFYPYDHSLPPTESNPVFDINQGANGQGCSSTLSGLPMTPSFSAGTTSAVAGTYSPFVLKLERSDGTQQISQLTTELPEGLLAKLAGIPYCPESGIMQAAARSREGEGALELASPSCPPASEIGTVTVSSGAGTMPLFVSGRAYLAGPYKGAPLSLEIITPAIAGPFDLGVVAVRTALQIDPFAVKVNAVSDPIPTILHGLPLDVRSISVDVSRHNFMLNPTSCEPKSIIGTATSTLGTVTPLNQYFQVTNCGHLKYNPQMTLGLRGATRRSGHPALRATITIPKKGPYANTARLQVGLPHSEFLDTSNLDKVCTQSQLRSATCPKRSVYGHAKVWTPLFDKPLKGNVYVGVGFGHKLPDLVVELNGQVRALLHGRVDTTKHEGIRNTFEFVPDAPYSKVVVELKGGKKYGLLENSENICSRPQRASTVFGAQDGAVQHALTPIGNECGKKKKGKKSKHRRHRS